MTYPEALWIFFILLSGIIIAPGMDDLRPGQCAERRPARRAHRHFRHHDRRRLPYRLGAFAVVGLSRLIPSLYAPMLLAGSLYMIWIGLTLVRSSITVDPVEASASRSLIKIFFQAIITCVLNPKAWLFVLAVYPQFIKPDFGPLWSQALVIGVMVAAMQFAVYGGLGLMASRGRNAMVGNPALTIWTGRLAGLLLVATAAFTMWRGWQGS